MQRRVKNRVAKRAARKLIREKGTIDEAISSVNQRHNMEDGKSPYEPRTPTRKEYGFRLLDPAMKQVARDWQWLATWEAREHVIRQSMSDGQFIIQNTERQV